MSSSSVAEMDVDDVVVVEEGGKPNDNPDSVVDMDTEQLDNNDNNNDDNEVNEIDMDTTDETVESNDDTSNRRSRRANQPMKSYRETTDGNDDDENVDDNDDVDDAFEQDEEQQRPSSRPRRKATSRGTKSGNGEDEDDEDSDTGKRRSGRSNKFASSMKEAPDHLKDLLEPATEAATATKPSNKKKKTSKKTSVADKTPDSPGKKRGRHASHRRKSVTDDDDDDDYHDEDENAMDVHDDYDDYYYEEAEEEDDETMKIQRILACRTETKKKWKEIGSTMNTSEVTNGSRWYQDVEENNGEDDDMLEERFLVKWNILSYLHVSWETQEDLIDQVENAKTYITIFFRKAENGVLFSQDDRKDGDYFDPDYTQIDRVLEQWLPEDESSSKKKKKNEKKSTVPTSWEEEQAIDPKVEFGVCVDKNDPKYEDGKGRQFFIKWSSLNYSDGTYEYEQDLLQKEEFRDRLKEYYERKQKPTKAEMKTLHNDAEKELRMAYKTFGDNSNISDDQRKANIQEFEDKLCQHTFRNGGQLRDYQAHGVTWLLANFVNKRSSILADEMGLGKTLQTAAFVNLLIEKMHRRRPFLICVPLSTITHWQREFENWTGLNTIVYHGTAIDRDYIRKFEFAYEEDRPVSVGSNALYLKKCTAFKSDAWMATVVITTPEMLVAEGWNELSAIKWTALVVDEAHRLKSSKSKLAANLRRGDFHFDHKVLLTGTPIQNNLEEFWTLLNFIDPDSYPNREDFLEVYGDVKTKESIDDLHEMIRPYILRRLKEDVEKSVPPKEETLIEVELTVLQKQYYKALYEKNVGFLHKNKKKALDGPSLNNLAMQLRKCCNHLFLLNGVEEEVRHQLKVEDGNEAEFMEKGSGKFVLLQKLLPRLKENGHRILIFSQFKIMLDVLEDYLRCREYKFERVDGSITGHRRQAAIDRFQDSKSKNPPFIMLLSTRAGGVGINLTAADTCIIFDSDWNPQNDLQAMARCHRIGQTKSVKIYRLLSRKSYEMQMFHLSSMKMGLNQTILSGFEKGTASEDGAMTKDEVEKLLRHGAYDIFSEDQAGTGEAESKDFVEQDIDSILARCTRQIVHENTGSGSAASGGTFSKASFVNTSKTASNDKNQQSKEDIDINDPDFWTKMVGEAQPEQEAVLQAKRQRKETNYNVDKWHRSIQEAISLDGDSGSSDNSDDSDDDDEDEAERSRWGGRKPGNWKRVHAEQLYDKIERFGYGMKSWETLKATLPKDAKYSITEIRRMAWSMVLSSLCEVSTSEGRVSARRIRSRRENEGEVSMLGGSAIADAKAEESMVESAFTKHLKQNSFWIKKAFVDAVQFAKGHQPRILTTNHNDTIWEMFGDRVWPSLQARGWREAEDDEGVFVYQQTRYNSPSEVMNEAIRRHPDLTDLIQQTLKKLEDGRLESDKIDEVQRNNDQLLSVSNADIKSVEDFLKKYGCLQLIAQRARSSNNVKMSMGKRFLTSVQYVHLTTILVSVADSSVTKVTDEADPQEDRLIRLIAVEDRVALPCEGWKSKHDAVLVRAISKHGWLDIDRSLKGIVNDDSIHWGEPFEKMESATTKPDVEEDVVGLATTGERASAFLNEHGGLFAQSKAFNVELIAKTYSLASTASSDGIEWTTTSTDISHLKSVTNESEDDSSGVMDLPPKKNLAARAKKLMSRPLEVLSQGGRIDAAFTSPYRSTVKTATTQNDSGHNYAVIDQNNKCNLFLVQLLRFIINTHPGSNADLHRIAFNAAEREIESKLQGSRDESWNKMMNQLAIARKAITKATVVSPGKNILRVMIGEPPKAGKPGSLTFPIDIDEKENIGNGVSVRGSKRVVKKSSGLKCSEGEKAIARALKAASSTNGGKSTVENTKDKDSLGLRLTRAETWLLLVACTQGIPLSTPPTSPKSGVLTVNKKWKDVAEAWWNMAAEQHYVASELVKKCSESLDRAIDRNAPQNQLTALAEQLHNTEKILMDREHDKNAVADLRKTPEAVAKKVIMLLETVRRYGFGTTPVNSAATHKFENFIGPRVPSWYKNELDKSITKEGLRERGRPILYTTVDVARNSPDMRNADINCLLDKKGAKQVSCQIALMSRLRSILLLNNEADFRRKINRAIKTSARLKDKWDDKPNWWDDASDEHSFLMLTRLNDHGFFGMMTSTEDTVGFGDPNDDGQADVGTLADIGLSKSMIQQRANQLVRELHQIEESERIMRRIDRRGSLDSLSSLPSPASGIGSSGNRSTKNATKQTNVTSFFQVRPSSGQKSKKKKPSTVLSVETADTGLRDGWRRKSPGSNNSSPDSLSSLGGKRKDRTELNSQKKKTSDSQGMVGKDSGDDGDDNGSSGTPSGTKKAKNGHSS